MRSLLIAFSAVFVFVFTGCGVNLSAKAPPYRALALKGGDCMTWGTVVSMTDNAGHSLPTIPVADVSAGVGQFYVLGAGSVGHEHQFEITAADFATLKGNMGIEVTTVPDATRHVHTVVINCNSDYVQN